jgi:hypothetical protein
MIDHCYAAIITNGASTVKECFSLNILCTPTKTDSIRYVIWETTIFLLSLCSEYHEKQTSRATERLTFHTSCGYTEAKGHEIEERE